MRKKLKEIGSGKRHTYTGTVVRFGKKNGYKGMLETVLLTDVKDDAGNIVTDHLWMNRTLGFTDAGISEGDAVEFQARVAVYTKGYFGYKEDVAYMHPAERDYTLSRPTHIRNLTHPERMTEEAKTERRAEAKRLHSLPLEETLSEAKSIGNKLGIPVPVFETESDAKMWIRQKQDILDLRITEPQQRYIAIICEKLRLENPDLKTKSDASRWIDEHQVAIRAFSTEAKYMARIAKAKQLHADGKSNAAIAEIIGVKQATIRKYLADKQQEA